MDDALSGSGAASGPSLEGAAHAPAPSIAYVRALDALFARTAGAIRPGLERTEALLGALGDPHRDLRVLHVAGTNGKGSSVAMAAALLEADGLRVGRYTSPHLVDFSERIVVDGRRIPEADVLELLERLTPHMERLDASFFEVTTAMALAHFRRESVDVAVVEVGLGGRLDATNVVRPLSAGVTSIGLDHQEYLGDSLEAIAREKAGIFKAGAPAVLGERDPALRAVLRKEAAGRGASCIVEVAATPAPRDVTVTARGTAFTSDQSGVPARLTTGLVGAHQAWNAAFTLEWLRAAGGPLAQAVRHAAAVLPHVRLPGRYELAGRWLFDVAHNPDGMRTLVQTLELAPPPRPLAALVCILGDKDWRTMLAALGPRVDYLVLTDAPSAPADRRWPLDEAIAWAREAGVRAVESEPDFEHAIVRSLAQGATVLVTGSFHTVGDAKARLPASPASG